MIEVWNSRNTTSMRESMMKVGEVMLLIENGTIYTMVNDIVIEKGYILIQDGRIKEVGKDFKNSKYSIETLERLDATNCVVLPGLIETHCHIGITEEKKGIEGDDSNEATNPITPYLKSIDAINPMDAAFDDAVRAGVTAVNVGPGSSNIVGGQFLVMKTKGSRCVDDMIVKEPSAMKIALGENPKSIYSQKGETPSSRMAIGYGLRHELNEAIKYRKRKNAAAEKGEEFEVDDICDCWLPVLEKEIPLKAHVHRADDILTAIRIAKEYDLNLTLDHCSEGHLIAEMIAKSGYPAIVGPSMVARNKIECQNATFKTAGVLHNAGVMVAITTDHPVSLIQYLPICAGLAAKEGLGVMEGLKAITINAAKICGVSDRLGSIEEGKDADIVIYDGNPMETFTHTLYTLINGRIVFDYKKDGE